MKASDRIDPAASGADQIRKGIPAANRCLISAPDLDTLEKFTSRADEVRVIDLKDCSTKRDLISRMGERLSFPAYSTANWDSFEECLAELEWFTGGTLVIAFINQIDSSLNDSDLSTLFALLRDVSEEWTNEGSRQLAAAVVGDVSQPLLAVMKQSGYLRIPSGRVTG